MVAKEKTKRSVTQDVVSREFTIHMHKYLHGKAFKKRAPSAIKAIKQFATKAMGTTDVRIDPTMNVAIWSRGIRNVPHRLRIQLSRRRNEAEDAAEKLYTLVTPITVSSFKGLQNITLDD